MGKDKKKVETFVFTTSQSPEAFKLNLREAVRAKGDMLYEDTESGFDFGVSRGGHSGGYWYCASLTETEAGSEMRGEIVYRTYHRDGELREDTKWEKLRDWMGIAVIVVFFSPVFLIALAIWGIMLLIGKLRGRPWEKTMTDGEKLTCFMTEVMGCSTAEE